MDLQARADRLAQLMEERLDIRGQGLEAKLARAGRKLPRFVRVEIEHIVLAQRMAESPKLAAQIDWDRLEKGADLVERHLRAIDAFDRRKTLAINWLAGNALNLVIVLALLLAVLVWRGFL